MKSENVILTDDVAINSTIEILSGKWKVLILFALCGKTRRFNELRRLIPDVTQRMLTAQLRELEKAKIIERKIYTQIPPKVEYSLSGIGKTLTPVLIHLKKWGADYHEKMSNEEIKKNNKKPIKK
jgi:DNA-binding HxlR family transcriptional regulator